MSLTSSVGSQDISLPEELLLDILWRMPGQRVFEFRRLSKYYKELIDGEDFIRNHYDESIRSRPSIILHQSITRGFSAMESVVIHLNFGSSKVNTFEPPFKNEGEHELPFLGCLRGILVYCSVWYNGFIQLMFWNPLTGALRRSRIAGTDDGEVGSFFSGHDAVTDDLKVLKITPRLDNSMYVCAIYSSRTDSWKRTRGFDSLRMNRRGKPLHLSRFDWSSLKVFVEGTNCVHMIISEPVEYSWSHNPVRRILAFDFSHERFNLVPLPKTTGKFCLSSVDSRLCLISLSELDNFEVWTMKEYGVKESWTRILSIHHRSVPSFPTGLVVANGRLQLLVFSSNGEPKKRLYLYDVDQNHLSDTLMDFDEMTIHDPQHFLFSPSHRKP